MKNYQFILIAVISLTVAVLSIIGIPQQYIKSDPLGEAMATYMFLTLGVLGLIAVDWKKLIRGLL